MELVSHGDCLGYKRIHIQSAYGTDGPSKGWSQHILHPQQAVNHFLGICTEPQHLADSLIHGTVCLIAVGLVLNHEHRHVGGGNASHGAHGLYMMAGNKGHFTGCKYLSCFFLCSGPSLKECRADTGTLYRVRHVLKPDWRSRMENHLALIQFFDDGLSRHHILDDRLAGNHFGDNGAVGLINIHFPAASQEIQDLYQLHVAPCGRRPVILDHVTSKGFYDLSKALKAHIDDSWLL